MAPIRRTSHWLLLGGIHLGGILLGNAPARAQNPEGPPAIVTNKTIFNLPILIDDATRAGIQELRLFVRGPDGKWKEGGRGPATQASFTFRAEADGEYRFTFASVDRAGKVYPADPDKIPPHRVVIIDTQAPTVTLTTRVEPGGATVAQFKCEDANPDWLSLIAQVDPGDGKPQPLERVSRDEPTNFKLPAEYVKANRPIQVFVKDRAGNLFSRMLPLPSAAAPSVVAMNPTPTPMLPAAPAIPLPPVEPIDPSRGATLPALPKMIDPTISTTTASNASPSEAIPLAMLPQGEAERPAPKPPEPLKSPEPPRPIAAPPVPEPKLVPPNLLTAERGPRTTNRPRPPIVMEVPVSDYQVRPSVPPEYRLPSKEKVALAGHQEAVPTVPKPEVIAPEPALPSAPRPEPKIASDKPPLPPIALPDLSKPPTPEPKAPEPPKAAAAEVKPAELPKMPAIDLPDVTLPMVPPLPMPAPMATPMPMPVQEEPKAPIVPVEAPSEPQPPMPVPEKVEVAAEAVEPNPGILLLNTNRCLLDYAIDGSNGKIEFWATRDNSRSWSRLTDEGNGKSPAQLLLPGDGIYGLTIRAGKNAAAPKAGDKAEVWVEVDTSKPIVPLFQAVLGEDSEAGSVTFRWIAQDKNLAPRPIQIFHAPKAEGPWQPIAPALRNDGSFRWPIPTGTGSQIHLRMEVSDRAGNVTKSTLQKPIVLESAKPKVKVLNIGPSQPTDGE